MFPEQEIAGYERYWRRRKPGSSTAVHYGSDVRIFFKWIKSENRVPYLRVTGKGQRERVVYLSATATQLLNEYLGSRSTESEVKVFLNRRGKPISITGIQLQLAKYCHQANIWVTCHQLRHTFACHMIAAGVPVTSIQKMLGHSSISTTQLYVRIADRQVEQDYHAGIQKLIESCVIMTEVPNG